MKGIRQCGQAGLLAALLTAACSTAPTNGRDTRQWLDLQKSGSAASTDTQPMTGEAADKVYKRYVDSFGHPLPESFPRESFSTTGGDGGGGSGGGQQ